FVCRLLHLKIISLKNPLQIGLCNKAVRPLDVELPSLDLFVSYRKNTESVGVKRFIDQLNKVFHLDKNLD
ncbi:hypothetical protein RR27_00990, partial [Acinetobacter baumannii]